MSGLLTIPCEFEHRRWEVPDEVLRRYGSPHFSRSEAGKAVETLARRHSVHVASGNHRIPRLAITAANEAYAEAAVADPVNDLLVWSDWRSGKRRFPYAGRYVPLDIASQQTKTVATSALGVLGEAVTGLYAQAGIGVSPLVRVIGRWPDLIFDSSGEIHFVEAKATTSEDKYEAADAMPWVSPAKLQEFVLNAVQQFGADPWVTIWGSFVTVSVPDASQMDLKVTFLELSAPSRRAAIPQTVPQIVWAGLARRAVARALALVNAEAQVWRLGSKERTWDSLKGIRRNRLYSAAREELEHLLETETPRLKPFAKDLEVDLTRTISMLEPGDEVPGRLDRLKMTDSDQGLPLREVGSEILMTRPLSDSELAAERSRWKQDWSGVSTPLSINGDSGYRAGGNLYWATPITTSNFHVEFDGYWREPNVKGLPDESGIFVVYACLHNSNEETVTLRRILYIGEAVMGRTRVMRHEMTEIWRNALGRGEVLCYSYAKVAEPYRHRILAALVYKHKPQLNTDYPTVFPFDETSVTTAGRCGLVETWFIVRRQEPTPVV